MKNYYEILEVNEHASLEVIEKAYKVLIKKYHPDLYVGEKKQYAEKRTRDINEAYRILSDEFLKEQYDAELKRKQVEEYVKEQETMQERINKNNQNMRRQRAQTQSRRQRDQIKQNNPKEQTHQVGTFGGAVALIKEIFKNKPKKINLKDLTKTDMYAIGLTIVILIILGIILWFIPFTNGWMRELIFENPLFSWMFN